MNKKCFRESKENYLTVSILPVISKIYEKLICKQIIYFMNSLLSHLSNPLTVCLMNW